jgi:vitamin B12 transporter
MRSHTCYTFLGWGSAVARNPTRRQDGACLPMLGYGLRPNPTYIVVGLAFLLLAPATASAQIQLPGIYVKGATLETPSAPTTKAPSGEPAPADGKDGDGADGVPAATVGNAITVIAREDLQRQQVRHAADALRSVPGVAVSRSGGFGNFTQVRIRGAEGNHTLVLIDGVEANNLSDGEFDFSNLSAEDIERIEVIRGPMSGLYGSNAVGGVVNIITRRGRGPMTASLRSEVGSFGTRDLAARLAGGDDRGHLAISYHWRETNGFNVAPLGSEDDGSRLGTVNIKGGVRLLDGVTLDFTVRHSEKVADRDGFGNIFDPKLAGSLATAFDDASVARDRILLAGANLKWEMLGGNLTHEFRANHNGTTTTDSDASFKSFSKNISDTMKLAYLATYRLDTPASWGKHSLSGLVEKEDEGFTPEGTFGDEKLRERGRVAYAGEWRGGFADRLFLTAGIRHDDNDNFQDFTTWRGAASLMLREWQMRPHASVGTAVKLPTMFEQFGSDQFFSPNPNLSPEQSFGWDAGIEFTFLKGNAVLDVTYFRANLEDKINGFFFDPEIGKFTAINLPGESTREGVELATRFKLSDAVTLGLAYTYLDARNPDGQREVRRPPHSGRGDVTYTFAGGRGTATLAAIYNGQMDDSVFRLVCFAAPCTPDPPNQLSFSPAGRLSLDAYWLINAAVSYKLQPGVELFGRVENLFDERYQEVFGFEAAPIAAFAGLKLTFGGPDGIDGASAR